MADRLTDSHPFRDPETLEGYALNRLPPRERSAIDEHCRGCPECRQLLEEELRLAAGVRRMAREQMQQRLTDRLSVPRSREIPWPRVIAVAATLIVVAGVSVVGLWLRQGREEVASAPDTTAPPYAAERDQLHPALTPPAGEKALPSPGGAAAPGAKSGVSESKDLAAAEGTKEGGRRSTELQNLEATTKTERAAGAAAAPHGGVGEYWTEGIVSEGPTGTGAARSDAMEENRPPAPEAQLRSARKAAATSITPNQQVMLTQEPSRLLQRQREQMQAKEKRVPTLVRKFGDQLTLTLYPDTLFSSAALQQASVRRSGEDSLFIQIGNQVIRYRLPSSLLQQVPAR